MSRKNLCDGKVHYSWSPPAEKDGSFLFQASSLALLTINGKTEVKRVRKKGRQGVPVCLF